MSIGTNLPVNSIADLAATIRQERGTLDAALNNLRARVERDPNFTGNAAESYDGFIAKWRSGQEQMLEGLDGAAGLLDRFHVALEDLGTQVTQGFNV
ncbi:WXG100 family type VII secretion target [Arthrobacter sp. 2MCAF14]|uniref:WXG100 family type VII secretion target n=1 Tax=Arthrobacter sp. 2MCAF14 TaxID=3232982 RepID=UPI003F8F4EF0